MGLAPALPASQAPQVRRLFRAPAAALSSAAASSESSALSETNVLEAAIAIPGYHGTFTPESVIFSFGSVSDGDPVYPSILAKSASLLEFDPLKMDMLSLFFDNTLPGPGPKQRHSAHQRDEIGISEPCGCFSCLFIFLPLAVSAWADPDKDGRGQTARCPHCGIDSVIGSASVFPIEPHFLKAMQRYWFSTAAAAPRRKRRLRLTRRFRMMLRWSRSLRMKRSCQALHWWK